MEADFDVKDFDNRNNGNVYPIFYWVPKNDEAASIAEGRPIFKDTEYVKIIVPGSSTSIVQKPVRDDDRRRFAAAYAKFKQGDPEQLIGTPLTEIPWLTRSQVEELAYLKVRTLENLADLNDSVCTNTPGMFDIKKKAQAWHKKAEEAKPFTAMSAEIEALRAEIAALKAAPPKVQAKG